MHAVSDIIVSMSTDKNDNETIKIATAVTGAKTGVICGIATIGAGALMLPLGALTSGIVYIVIGACVTGLGIAAGRKAIIKLPSAKPAYELSNTVKELSGKLLEYIDSIDNKSSEAAKKYIRTAGKMRQMLFIPEYESNAYDDDKSLIRILVMGTSLNKGYMAETPEMIDKNSRYIGLGGQAEKDARNNLDKICQQLDDISETIDKIQSHIVSNTNMEVESSSNYLKMKLGNDAPDSLKIGALGD